MVVTVVLCLFEVDYTREGHDEVEYVDSDEVDDECEQMDAQEVVDVVELEEPE